MFGLKTGLILRLLIKRSKIMKLLMVMICLTPVTPVITVPVFYGIYRIISWIRAIILT